MDYHNQEHKKLVKSSVTPKNSSKMNLFNIVKHSNQESERNHAGRLHDIQYSILQTEGSITYQQNLKNTNIADSIQEGDNSIISKILSESKDNIIPYQTRGEPKQKYFNSHSIYQTQSHQILPSIGRTKENNKTVNYLLELNDQEMKTTAKPHISKQSLNQSQIFINKSQNALSEIKQREKSKESEKVDFKDSYDHYQTKKNILPLIQSPPTSMKKLSFFSNDKNTFEQEESQIGNGILRRKGIMKSHDIGHLKQQMSLMNFHNSIQDQYEESLDDEERNLIRQYRAMQQINKLLVELQGFVNLNSEPNQEIFVDNLKEMSKLSSLVHIEPSFTIQITLLYAKMLRDFNDFVNCIMVLKQAMIQSNIIRTYDIKLEVYYQMADLYLFLQQFSQSLVYLRKLLQLSWKLNNDEYELKAYEYIGQNYYYLNDLEMAQFYHDQALANNKEARDSQMRLVGESLISFFTGKSSDINNVILNYDSGSDDEYDLYTLKSNSKGINQNKPIFDQESHKSGKTKSIILTPAVIVRNEKIKEIGKQYYVSPQLIKFEENPKEQQEKLKTITREISQIVMQNSINRNLDNLLMYSYENRRFAQNQYHGNNQTIFYYFFQHQKLYEIHIQDMIVQSEKLIHKIVQKYSNQN